MLDLALDDRIYLNSELDCALQELDLILNTENTELIGYPEYGSNFEQFLWNLTDEENEIRNYIKEKISQGYWLNKFYNNISVKLVKGEVRSIYVVSITIYDKAGNAGSRTYKFQ